MSFPNKIYFKSDGCSAEFVSELINKKSTDRFGMYRYLDGFYFKGSTVNLELSQLNK